MFKLKLDIAPWARTGHDFTVAPSILSPGMAATLRQHNYIAHGAKVLYSEMVTYFQNVLINTNDFNRISFTIVKGNKSECTEAPIRTLDGAPGPERWHPFI